MRIRIDTGFQVATISGEDCLDVVNKAIEFLTDFKNRISNKDENKDGNKEEENDN